MLSNLQKVILNFYRTAIISNNLLMFVAVKKGVPIFVSPVGLLDRLKSLGHLLSYLAVLIIITSFVSQDTVRAREKSPPFAAPVSVLKTWYAYFISSPSSITNIIFLNLIHCLGFNLEFIMSNARDKREEHLNLVGIILPIEDPFCDIYLPPSEWNCKCSFRPTDKPATDVPKITQMVPPTFQNNPGKTAELVKLNEHPYLKGKGVATCPECRRQGLVSSGSGDELCQTHKLIFRDLRDKTKQALLNWRDTLPKK